MKILFVCSGNTCRSPMASALFLQGLRDLGAKGKKREWEIWSAGLWTYNGLPASAPAVAAMREQGVDLSQHRSAQLGAGNIIAADLILTMTTRQRDYLLERFPAQARQIFTLSEFTGDASGEVVDPYGQDLEAYRASLAQIKFLVDRLLHKIIESG
ncbi:MAG: low molecular weight protein arginine phosphatase [Firmicutes bacterium]|nr:low molecular weight protein arginine phosphatase [Bacillota bacterium]